MRVACVSYFYDHELTTPEALLERYGTLTGWAEGLAAAGADVIVTAATATMNAHMARKPSPSRTPIFRLLNFMVSPLICTSDCRI